MLKNLWRYSHFILAVSSSLFLLLATLSGLILAFGPINAEINTYQLAGSQDITIQTLINNLGNDYDEILEINRDASGAVQISAFSSNPAFDGDFYLDPVTGKKIAEIQDKHPVFTFTTNLHRSLFLKTPGRIFVGIASFLLLLIVISGLGLLIKRQGGFSRVFSRVIKENREQYYHVTLGRWAIVPILIIAITGCYLSLVRFEIIATTKGEWENGQTTEHGDAFERYQLKDLRSLEFPFTKEPEDYYTLSLKDRELKVHQYTGDVVQQRRYPFSLMVAMLSFDLHTGAGNWWWAAVLAGSCLSMLYFMYSGALISIARLKSKTKNKFSPQEAEYVILVGSENGSTKHFGHALQHALIDQKKKVYLDDLNNFQSYKQINHLIVLTSTYGDGEAPANASKFIETFHRTPIHRPFQSTVVGFGSRSYSKFCQYAMDVHDAISDNNLVSLPSTPTLINDKNLGAFQDWARSWSVAQGLSLNLPTDKLQSSGKALKLTIVAKKSTQNEEEETFTLELSPKKRLRVHSGDLLSITPPGDAVERLYSVGVLPNGNMIISVKRHNHGICSNYLNQLVLGETFTAAVKNNTHFHLPNKATALVMIGNGTGIGPFLGMINTKTTPKKHLYWGGRTTQSFVLYEDFISRAQKQQSLQNIRIALSQESKKQYVQDLLLEDQEKVARLIKKNSTLMICGSLAMKKGVLEVLATICSNHGLPSIQELEQDGFIRSDCY
ncbi:PepSY domain-containing protein [Marinoscillum furvescens]|uniref:Sulfite reductase (NADPH) flavoprotein alpha-component n=1 Tax=Marinoscillum furvescens DSM 4134 TaxID=1122208 RepID=A0A3D9L181_MARFU|nr:PepSY domain-containing protein [Marinoscillum furvescens]RED96580.1 sulfite reductase (NADPH) flavoprotein alpha-component [Marinoscillum furvescens DSM 4134]